MLLPDRTKKMTPPGTSRMRELANELKKSVRRRYYQFCGRRAGWRRQPSHKDAAKAAIDSGCNKYTPTLGMKELPESIAKQVSKRCGTPYGAEEVAVTAGAKQVLYNAAMVLRNPGDEVIIPRPYWVTFPAQVELAGAKPVYVDTRQTAYKLCADQVEEAITAATKASIINRSQ